MPEGYSNVLVRFERPGIRLYAQLSYGVYRALLPLLDAQPAYALCYAFGVLTQYLMHSRYVFHVPLSWRGLFGYPWIHAALYAFGAGLLWLLVEWARVSKAVAPLLVIVASLPISFVLTRAWLARDSSRQC